jgi:hypothetical protein
MQDRVEQRIRARADAATRANEALNPFREAIRSDPRLDTLILKSVSEGLKRIAWEVPAGTHPTIETERICMELVCEAIKAGAFAGHSWLVWRTRLVQSPSISKASILFKDNAPHGWPHSYNNVHTTFDFHLRELAEQIERFIPIADVKPMVSPDAPSVNAPLLNISNGKWVKNKLAAKLDGLETRTLATYRMSGTTNSKKDTGIDKDGRIWRREGTPNSHPWYLKSSLKSEQLKN